MSSLRNVFGQCWWGEFHERDWIGDNERLRSNATNDEVTRLTVIMKRRVRVMNLTADSMRLACHVRKQHQQQHHKCYHLEYNYQHLHPDSRIIICNTVVRVLVIPMTWHEWSFGLLDQISLIPGVYNEKYPKSDSQIHPCSLDPAPNVTRYIYNYLIYITTSFARNQRFPQRF